MVTKRKPARFASQRLDEIAPDPSDEFIDENWPTPLPRDPLLKALDILNAKTDAKARSAACDRLERILTRARAMRLVKCASRRELTDQLAAIQDRAALLLSAMATLGPTAWKHIALQFPAGVTLDCQWTDWRATAERVLALQEAAHGARIGVKDDAPILGTFFRTRKRPADYRRWWAVSECVALAADHTGRAPTLPSWKDGQHRGPLVRFVDAVLVLGGLQKSQDTSGEFVKSIVRELRRSRPAAP